MSEHQFQIGDVVERTTWRNTLHELIPYESPEESMAETKTLYSFTKADGTVAYGSHIGTNSSNNYLIEEKGTGEIHVLDPKSIEEVLPYTFSATIAGKETHYVSAGCCKER